MAKSIHELLEEHAVFLEITTFRGAIGIHYYGTLVHGQDWDKRRKTDVDMERTLSAKGAAALNKLDGFGDRYGLVHKRGNKTRRLDNEQQARTLAIQSWREHFPQAKLLICGEYIVAEPQEILDGLEDKDRNSLNELWQEYEECVYPGGHDYRGDTEPARRIEEEWEGLIEAILEPGL